MATEVLSSPDNSPLSSPITSRRVVNLGTSIDGGGRNGRPSLSPLQALQADAFDSGDETDDDKHDEEEQDEEDKQQHHPSCLNHHHEQQRMNDLLIDTCSQQSFLSHVSATQSELLTQNADLTQMTQDGNDLNLSLSPFPISSAAPIRPQPLPWGRLMPCSGGKAVDLTPKPPSCDSPHGVLRDGSRFSIVGLDNLQPSDIFNVFTMGRSLKCDIVTPKPKKGLLNDKEKKLLEWAFGLVSNRHARIYCTLPDNARGNSNITVLPASCMEVWIEDSSNNGTWINQSIRLKRGQKRRLHPGDEIALVSRTLLQKRVHDDERLQAILQQYSFVFVNVAHHNFKTLNAEKRSDQRAARMPVVLMGASPVPPTSSSSTKRRAGLVNPRAMNYPPGSRSPKPATGYKQQQYHHRSPTAVALAQAPPRSSGQGYGTENNSLSAVLPEAGSPRRIEQEYEIRDLLGRGTCGEVRRAIHRQTGKAFAVKIISLPPPSLLSHKQQEEAQQWQAEARILQTLDEHPYIVRLVDTFVTDAHLYLVMDLCEGDLFDKVSVCKYSETNSRRIMRRLLSAIHYMHEDCEIIHRDLKPENILLTGNNAWDVKITDFGVASASANCKTFCGTPLYFAPEVLERRHTVFAKGRYGKSADMWSLGVILYILLSGAAPYSIDGKAGMDVILQKSLQIDFPRVHWAFISAEAIDLVTRMLNKDPFARITVREACDHPWIQIEDGDTHCHPLEDPRLMSVTKKRLFACASPIPLITATASPRKSPSNKRKKISMESAMNQKTSHRIEAFDVEEMMPPMANNPPRPLSPVENRSDSNNTSPAGSTGDTVKRLRPVTECNDENSELQKPRPASSKLVTSTKANKFKQPTEILTSTLKLSPMLADSLKAKILLAGTGRGSFVRKEKPKTMPEEQNAGHTPVSGQTSSPITEVDCVHEPSNERSHTKNALPSLETQKAQPAAATEKVRKMAAATEAAGEQTVTTQGLPRRISRPSRWNKDQAAVGTARRRPEASRLDDSDSKKVQSKVWNKTTSRDGLVKATELPEDRICSQFSDEERVYNDEEDNGGDSGTYTAEESLQPKHASLSQSRKTRVEESDSSAKIPPAKKTKVSAKTTRSGKKGGDTDKSQKDNAKQATLARWFQPLKK